MNEPSRRPAKPKLYVGKSHFNSSILVQLNFGFKLIFKKLRDQKTFEYRFFGVLDNQNKVSKMFEGQCSKHLQNIIDRTSDLQIVFTYWFAWTDLKFVKKVFFYL